MLATETQPVVTPAVEVPLNEVLAIDIPRVAQVLDISAKTVRRRIKDGTIPSVRIGGMVRVPVEGLKRMLAGVK